MLLCACALTLARFLRFSMMLAGSPQKKAAQFWQPLRFHRGLHASWPFLGGLHRRPGRFLDAAHPPCTAHWLRTRMRTLPHMHLGPRPTSTDRPPIAAAGERTDVWQKAVGCRVPRPRHACLGPRPRRHPGSLVHVLLSHLRAGLRQRRICERLLGATRGPAAVVLPSLRACRDIGTTRASFDLYQRTRKDNGESGDAGSGRCQLTPSQSLS